jgi:hypothetical protein
VLGYHLWGFETDCRTVSRRRPTTGLGCWQALQPRLPPCCPVCGAGQPQQACAGLQGRCHIRFEWLPHNPSTPRCQPHRCCSLSLVHAAQAALALPLQGVVLPDGYTAEVKARERVGTETGAIRLDTVC